MTEYEEQSLAKLDTINGNLVVSDSRLQALEMVVTGSSGAVAQMRSDIDFIVMFQVLLVGMILAKIFLDKWKI